LQQPEILPFLLDWIDMKTEKFGTVLGMAPGNVPAYSSDYASADLNEFPNRKSYRSFIDGVFMGYKWQCVEFVRRWLFLKKQYVFDDVSMAYDIFRLRDVKKLSDNRRLPLHSFKNGARRRPEPGCLLIWDAAGEFEITGHVALVTEVHDDFIRFAEQNVDNQVWPEGQTFSRQLKTRILEDGGYWIEPGLENDSLLGWVIQTDDETFSEDIADIDMGIFPPIIDSVDDTGKSGSPWIDTNHPAGAAYVASFGHTLTGDEGNAHKYFCLSEMAFSELKRATNELHHLFMRATDYVLQDDTLLQHFNIPSALWPKIRDSWNNRKNSMITGRFDFCISENGLKVYEYNADSASCYLETARLQAEWASHYGCKIGRSPGEKLYGFLVKAWRAQGIKDVLHIMQDIDAEETYHALFMKSAMEEAGITVKVLQGVTDLHWHKGNIVDSEGIQIKQVWKTWAWETVLDQIRDELEEHDIVDIDVDSSSSPRLVDVLLQPEVMVHEPLWTLIPSNKAILPVIWMLFPDRPYLLNSQFELTDTLQNSGYVEKPIVGRCGENIVITDSDDIIGKTDGRFGNRKRIYQSLFRLPTIDRMNVQICTFAVAGSFGGACVRVDSSLVIRGESDVMPLRIIADDEYRALQGVRQKK
jgi:glutathionylspermidine amidase/synthetase